MAVFPSLAFCCSSSVSLAVKTVIVVVKRILCCFLGVCKSIRGAGRSIGQSANIVEDILVNARKQSTFPSSRGFWRRISRQILRLSPSLNQARSYRTHCISQAETQKLLAPSLSSFRTSSKIVNSHDHEHWEVRKFRKVLRSKVGNLVASAPRERNLPSGAFLEANLQQPNSAAITTNGPLQEELVLIVILFILFFGNQLLRRGQWQAPASFNEDYFSEWPGGRRPLSTTWPWNVKPSLLVIWGVCWMFYYANEELRRRRPRSEPNATTGAGPVMNIPIRTLSAQQYGYETGAHSLTSSVPFAPSGQNFTPLQYATPQFTATHTTQTYATSNQAALPTSVHPFDRYEENASESYKGIALSQSGDFYALPASCSRLLASPPPSTFPPACPTQTTLPYRRSFSSRSLPPPPPIRLDAFPNPTPPSPWFASPQPQGFAETHQLYHPNLSSLQPSSVASATSLPPPYLRHTASTNGTFDDLSLFAPIPPSQQQLFDFDLLNAMQSPNQNYPSPYSEVSERASPLGTAGFTMSSSPRMIKKLSPEFDFKAPFPKTPDLQTPTRRVSSDIPTPPRNTEGLFYCDHPNCRSDPPKFTRKCEWKKHRDKHDRPYRCPEPECGNQGFTYSAGLSRHLKEVHNKLGGPRTPQMCPFPDCKRHTGTGFSRKENLNEHMRRVHPGRQPGDPIVGGSSSVGGVAGITTGSALPQISPSTLNSATIPPPSAPSFVSHPQAQSQSLSEPERKRRRGEEHSLGADDELEALCAENKRLRLQLEQKDRDLKALWTLAQGRMN